MRREARHALRSLRASGAGGERKPKRVTVLEPDASPALRECLLDATLSTALAKPLAVIPNPYTTSVPFAAPAPPHGIAAAMPSGPAE